MQVANCEAVRIGREIHGMDGAGFDAFARVIASRGSRRGVLASVATVITGSIGLRNGTNAHVTTDITSSAPCVYYLFGSGGATGDHHIRNRLRLAAPAPTGGGKWP
jgi:hypothetical protein